MLSVTRQVSVTRSNLSTCKLLKGLYMKSSDLLHSRVFRRRSLRIRSRSLRAFKWAPNPAALRISVQPTPWIPARSGSMSSDTSKSSGERWYSFYSFDKNPIFAYMFHEIAVIWAAELVESMDVDVVQDAGNLVLDYDVVHRHHAVVWIQLAVCRAGGAGLGLGRCLLLHLVCWYRHGWDLLIFSCRFWCLILVFCLGFFKNVWFFSFLSCLGGCVWIFLFEEIVNLMKELEEKFNFGLILGLRFSNYYCYYFLEQTTGSLYFWAAHLAGPVWGPFASWCCAWLETIGLIAGIGTQVYMLHFI